VRWRGDRVRGRRQLALTGGEALAEAVRLAVELKQLAAVGDPVKPRRDDPRARQCQLAFLTLFG